MVLRSWKQTRRPRGRNTSNKERLTVKYSTRHTKLVLQSITAVKHAEGCGTKHKDARDNLPLDLRLWSTQLLSITAREFKTP
jgi:hypothetical protein